MINERPRPDRQPPKVGEVREYLHYEQGEKYRSSPIPGTPDEILMSEKGMTKRALLISAGALAASLAMGAVGTRLIPGPKSSSPDRENQTENDFSTSEFELEDAWEYTVQDGETVSGIINREYPYLDDETIVEIVYSRVVVQRSNDPRDVDRNVDDVYGGDILHIYYEQPEEPTPQPEGESENG